MKLREAAVHFDIKNIGEWRNCKKLNDLLKKFFLIYFRNTKKSYIFAVGKQGA